MMQRLKADGVGRLKEDKNKKERKRNLFVIIMNYLVDNGYVQAASSLSSETGLSLDKWDTCDNIDLYYILQDYEEYYQIKFGKPPKLIKQIQEDKKSFLPQKVKPPLVSGGPAESKVPDRSSAGIGKKILAKKDSKTEILKKGEEEKEKKEKGGGANDPLVMEGQAVSSKKEEPPKQSKEEAIEGYFEGRVLPALPDYGFNKELKQLAALIQREIIVENPGVTFQDIVGLSDCKKLLKEAVLMPMKYPHFFQGLLEPWKGILLFGPPGTGKTMLAKAVATECRTTFFNISASTIISKWRGDSEKLVRLLFELARHYEPSTIFLDEIDSIMSSRTTAEHEASRRMKTELLIQLDGLLKGSGRVFLLAASNLPWELDMALLRRLEKRILVPMPTIEARERMLNMYVGDRVNPKKFPFAKYAKETAPYSGSDIRLVCKEAAMRPLRRLMDEIEKAEETEEDPNWWKPVDPESIPKMDNVNEMDFDAALASTKPSTVDMNEYIKWFKEMGSV